ncbi:solute carrier family 15 member 4-like [Physella acuta]|uniref:solute carrier family 15 member 4-like n=1 Tax=Physella acuta TaxID=109671 RepID=UPI0027DD83B6|nr:solute carrier family 15 member 4-like [Physella acuta]XP_059157144.1 solute carrier family 15 member 4-like [Physella acuta]XP_059157145.1 solute carrier family 15 member 4-like [Physella acuta]
MLRAEEDEEAPLLKNKLWRSLTISDEDEQYKQKDTGRVHVKYEPKLTVFSPYKLFIVLSILLVEMCERMAYYGVVANLVLFCTSVLDYTSNEATNISLIFTGSVYLIPIIGGLIADSWSNRFNVIFGSGLIYLCGLFLVVCAAINYQNLFNDPAQVLSSENRRIFYIVGLVLVAIGTGGIKANVGLFGAQQVQDLGPEAVQTFFNWFYWFVNAGGLIAFSAIAHVQQNISFTWGFFIPLVSMLLSLIILNVARKHYIYKSGQGSVLITTFKICGQACCRKSPVIDGKSRLFDSARKGYGGDFDSFTVDGVIAVLRLLPIFFFVIMFWAIYSQMQSTYFLQGERMDLSLGTIQIPVALLNVFNTIAVLLSIPILDRVVYPCFQRIGRPMRYMHRIGIGLVLSACSVFVAGWVEIERKQELGFNQVVGEETFYASNLTVFLQVPQFMLVGAGEAFTNIAGLEFAYTQAPKNLQGLIMGVYLATNGVGNYVSTAIIAIIEASTTSDPWFPDDINNGKAEYVFFVFGGLMVLFFLGYLPAAYTYKYQEFLTDEEAEKRTNVTKSKWDKQHKMFDQSSITIL